MMPEKKTDTVRRLVADGDFKRALSIVKGFRLGIAREDMGIMKRAYECLIYPDFYRQLGQNTDEAIAEGIATLKAYYGQSAG